MKDYLRTLAVVVVLLSPAWAAHNITLNWTQTTDPVALNCVFRASTAGGENASNPLFCSTTPITTYIDTAVAAGDQWFYTVDAVSAKGVASPFSNEATAVVPLLPPTGMSATGH